MIKKLEKFGHPILDREQEVHRDIESFNIKGLSNNQFKDIKCIFRKNKEVFMGPARPAEVGEHHTDLKPGVISKKPKLYSVSIYCLKRRSG